MIPNKNDRRPTVTGCVVVDSDSESHLPPPLFFLQPHTAWQVFYLLHDDNIDEVHQHKDQGFPPAQDKVQLETASPTVKPCQPVLEASDVKGQDGMVDQLHAFPVYASALCCIDLSFSPQGKMQLCCVLIRKGSREGGRPLSIQVLA